MIVNQIENRSREKIHVPTQRGCELDGVLFHTDIADTVVIIVTGVLGNFDKNPFYYNIGDTLNAMGCDFIYAQSCDAYPRIETNNVKTGKRELIGAWNERFDDAVDDVSAYVAFAKAHGYEYIILGGHSFGANKVIRYLSENPNDNRIERFILIAPIDVAGFISTMSSEERHYIEEAFVQGRGDEMLPFPIREVLNCTVATGHDWLSSKLDNTHSDPSGDYSQAEKIQHSGALIIGEFDRFANGSPTVFLENLNSHMQSSMRNQTICLKKTGHSFLEKEQELADTIALLISEWKASRL